MGYPRIIQKVYREPWLINPSVRQSIQASLTSKLNGDPSNDYEQAERDTEKNGKKPIVLYKSTNKKWLVIADAEYILKLLADQNETTF